MIFESARITSRLLPQDLGLALATPVRRDRTVPPFNSRGLRDGKGPAHRRHRRRARRARGGLHPRRARPRVILFEKNAWLGGKAAVLEERGFRFDMGPTILTVPRVLARIFAEAGRRLEDELDLVRLDPQWRCFFADGSTLDLRRRRRCHGGRNSRRSPQAVASPRAMRPSSRSRNGCTNLGPLLLLEAGREPARHDRSAGATSPPPRSRDVLSLRMGATVAGTVRGECTTPASPRCSTTSRSTSARRPTAPPAVLCGIAHMQTARASGTRSAAPAPCPRRSRGWPSSSAWRSGPAPTCAGC